jgi:hypothetical protein
LKYYDLVSGSCEVSADFAKRLGFERVFRAGVDIKLVDSDSEKGTSCDNCIAYGTDKKRLTAFAGSGARGVAIKDMRADGKLLSVMSENNCILCIPTTVFTSRSGIERSKLFYRAGILLDTARKKHIRVSFISIADSKLHVCSYMQLIEIAKLVGADEQFARNSISTVNGELLVK